MKNIFKFCRKKCNMNTAVYLELLGTMLIHELRSPFITIKSGASIVKNSMEKLVSSYNIAREKNITVPEIPIKHLDKLSDFLNSIEEGASVANFFVNLVGFILRSEHNQQNTELFEIKSVISNAIERLPKYLKTKNTNLKIIDQSQNISLKANLESLEMVFCTLIYDAIQRSLPNKALLLNITSTKHPTSYQLEFKDNAQQINAKELFDRYYIANGELQLGLYYCKNIMQKIGGNIAYSLTEDQKNTYILSFPII